MSRTLVLSCVLAGAVGASSAWAHHSGKTHTVSTVMINQTVLADGKPLSPGTYEVYVLDERPTTPEGTPSENQRYVEFARNGQVVAREIAEVFWRSGNRGVVGTSGTAESAGARVDTLRGGEFVRVAVNESGNRYLIHLPIAAAAAKLEARQP